MRSVGQFIDVVQTVGIIVIALAVIWALLRFERDIRTWLATLEDINRRLGQARPSEQKQMIETLEKVIVGQNEASRAVSAAIGEQNAMKADQNEMRARLARIEQALDMRDYRGPPGV